MCRIWNFENGNVDYVKGANVAGFVKVADSMIDQVWYNPNVT